MNQLSTKLTGLLIAQLAVAIAIWSYAQSNEDGFTVEPLIAVKADEIDRLVIATSDKSITVKRENNRWMLPDNQNLPANHTKVDETLAKLTALKTAWPVATTSSSHQRFEVADDKYQRKIQIYHGDELKNELFLGSSPGFKKVHLRRAGEQAVYAQSLNHYDFSVKTIDWIERSLLAAKNLNKIKHQEFQLEKVEEKWLLSSGADTAIQPEVENVEKLAKALTAIQVMDVVENPPQFDGEKTKELIVQGDAEWQYQFYKDGESYYVKRSDIEPVFTLSQFEYERVANITLDDLKSVNKPISENGQEPVASSKSDKISDNAKDS